MSQEKSITIKKDQSEENPAGEGRVMIFDMPSCGGCSTCELACSFHHTGEFSTESSSLKILDKEGEEGCKVLLVAECDGQSIPCDGCEDLDVPLCMEYCREMDDLGKILNKFEEKRHRKKRALT